VEHPELVAQRLERFVAVMGADRVIAGADCGYQTSAGNMDDIPRSVVWAKLNVLVEGTRLACRHLQLNAE
jgi:5-methyltetrahydropteroyltriglutamate--homocysteine methyltransferase